MSTKSIPGSIAAAALLALAALSAPAQEAAPAQDAAAETFHFGTNTKHTNITFVSEADIENIYGSTTEVSGTATLDFAKGEGSCDLTIPVKSLKTGIDMRDEHLRGEKWLHEEKYKDIRFAASSITSSEEAKAKWKAKGKMTIKGTTKDVEADVTVKRIPEKFGPKLGKGAWIKVTTTFDLDVTEYGVEIPEGVGPKVSKTWTIKFDCFATTEKPEEE